MAVLTRRFVGPDVGSMSLEAGDKERARNLFDCADSVLLETPGSHDDYIFKGTDFVEKMFGWKFGVLPCNEVKPVNEAVELLGRKRWRSFEKMLCEQRYWDSFAAHEKHVLW